MFRSASRRSFATLERLGELAGTGIVMAGMGTVPADLRPAQRAMAIAEAANDALDLVIDTAGDTKRTYKAMTPDVGVTATLFIAHGLTEINACLAEFPGHHLSVGRLREVRQLLRDHFPWTEDDEQEVLDATAALDPETSAGKDEAELQVALGSMRRLVGNEAHGKPGFVEFAEDPYSAGMRWRICFNHAASWLLERTDPDGLARFRASL